jgi:hypothetical protein
VPVADDDGEVPLREECFEDAAIELLEGERDPGDFPGRDDAGGHLARSAVVGRYACRDANHEREPGANVPDRQGEVDVLLRLGVVDERPVGTRQPERATCTGRLPLHAVDGLPGIRVCSSVALASVLARTKQNIRREESMCRNGYDRHRLSA